MKKLLIMTAALISLQPNTRYCYRVSTTDGCGHEAVVEDCFTRITSYNVCYTKLLR